MRERLGQPSATLDEPIPAPSEPATPSDTSGTTTQPSFPSATSEPLVPPAPEASTSTSASPVICPTPTPTPTTPTPTQIPSSTPTSTPGCLPSVPEITEPANGGSTSTDPTLTPTSTPDRTFGFSPALSAPARTELSQRENYNCEVFDAHWHGDRQYACRSSDGLVQLFDKPLGTPGRTLVGEVAVRELRDSALSWKTNKWTERYSLKILYVNDASGTSGTTTVSANGGCTTLQGVCGVSGENLIASRTATDGLDLTRQWTNTMNWPSGSRPVATGTWQMRIKFKSGTTVSPPSANSPLIRCDNDPNMRDYFGCAFYQAPPVLDYSAKANIGDFNAHVARAQQSGLPGAPNGAPLNRVYEPTIS